MGSPVFKASNMVLLVEGDTVLTDDTIRLHISDNTDASRPEGKVKVVLSAAPSVTWYKGFGDNRFPSLYTKAAKKSAGDYLKVDQLRKGCTLYKARIFANNVSRKYSDVKVQNGWDPTKVYEFTWIKD